LYNRIKVFPITCPKSIIVSNLPDNINIIHSPTSKAPSSSNASQPKISAERSTISTSQDLEITNSEKLAAPSTKQQVSTSTAIIETYSTSSAVETPSKRLFSDRTPPLLPVDSVFRPSSGINKKNKQMAPKKNAITALPEHNFNIPSNMNFGITMLPQVATHATVKSTENFSLSVESAQPQAEETHAPPPNWVSTILDRFRQYDDRLSQLEHLVAENQRLRAELNSANIRIQELEKQSTTSVEFPVLAPTSSSTQGTEASKYASAIVNKNSTTEESTQSSAISFASVAAKGKHASTPPKTPKAKRTRRITPRQFQAITRTFTTVSESHGYQYIYLPSRYREAISSLRTKLRKLKINNARVLDVHFPDNHVVALLIHNDYVEELLSIFDKAGVKPLDNFDPLDAQRLRNPLFNNLDPEARQSKCVEIHQTRLLRALDHIRESVRVAVARDFMRKQWITDDQFKTIVMKTSSTSLPVGTTTTQADTDMSDVLDTFVVSSAASSKSLTGEGEPVDDDL